MATLDPLQQVGINGAADDAKSAQWWLLFAVMVANKPADQTRDKLIKLLASAGLPTLTPFEQLHWLIESDTLTVRLKEARTGQYRRIGQAFRDIHDKAISTTTSADPRLWTLEEIEAVRGIGPKTSRWFYMLINPKAKVAALDTHVLKFLRDQGETVPKGTPPKGKKYHELEQVFLKWADKLGVIPRDLDYFVWTIYRNKGKITF